MIMECDVHIVLYHFHGGKGSTGEIPFPRHENLQSKWTDILHLLDTWYNKDTDTGLIMNFQSLAPRRYKHSVVAGFVHRIYSVCSSWHNFHESLEKTKTILLKKKQYTFYFFGPIMHTIIY